MSRKPMQSPAKHGDEKLRISFGHPTFDRTERATALLGTVQSSELVDLFERLGLTHRRQR